MTRNLRHLPAFQKFHSENLHVYSAIEAECGRLIGGGRLRIGVKRVVEDLRWDSRLVTNGQEFKLNNNFTRYYADLVVARNPQWDANIERRGR